MIIKNNKKIPKSSHTYVGIDQSLTCTAVATLRDGEIIVEIIKPDCRGVKRLNYIYNEFKKLLPENIRGAAIEGYSFGSTGNTFNLGELGGILRLALFEKSITSIQVPPPTLKKFLAGVGNANKNVMLKELYRQYDIDVNDDNICDAISLAILAYEFYETQYHCVDALKTDLHKKCEIIINDHPNILSPSEYLKDMDEGIKVFEYEKVRKNGKSIRRSNK